MCSRFTLAYFVLLYGSSFCEVSSGSGLILVEEPVSFVSFSFLSFVFCLSSYSHFLTINSNLLIYPFK